MLRRLHQRPASVAGVAVMGVAPSNNSTTQHLPAMMAMTSLLSTVGSAAIAHQWSGRSFIRIRMVKSANQPAGDSSGGGADASAAASSSSSSPSVAGHVINSEDDASGESYQLVWASRDFYQRLGLNRKCTDKEIRARYIDLAKKFHPDLASGSNEHTKNLPPNVKPEDVFKNIKEAYEALSNPQTRAFIDARGSEEYQERQNQGFGVSPEEFARQQAIKQMFSDGLPFFIASVTLFLAVMAYHYKSRINTSSLYYFIVILLVMSFFPRILAAALMYLMHCNDMILVYEKEAQAAALVTVTAKQSAAAVPATRANSKALVTPSKGSSSPAAATVPLLNTPMDVTVRVEGVEARHIPEGNLVVTVRRTAPATAAPAAAASSTDAKAETTAAEEEVFVFAKGVTAVTIPLMLPATPPATENGLGAPTWEMHVRFVNDSLKLTLMDKKAYL